ncbi:MAG: PD40 domain-containing protein, partial [Deltaproteobacteria bacterium]|nr:PD40 domain-containing protein [Deltaproteobacteria bacterium]
VERRTVIDGGDGVEISTPRFSPDGTMIVASRFSRGRRDIVLYDRKRQVDLQITHDRAQDIDPIFSPDGRWILFSSDRNGIYNVYAYDLSSRVLSQVTNVVGGAFSPSLTPNQSILVFRGYSSDGFDVYATSFTPESARIVGQVRTATVTRCPTGDPCPSDREVRRPPALARDLEGVPPEDLGPGVLSSESSWSTSSYSALDTLLPFHDNWNLKPSFSWDQRQAHLTLLTEAHDPLDRHRYSLFFDYGTGIPFASAGVSYSNLQTRAIYAIGGQIMASSKVSTDSGGERNFADYRKYVGSLSVTLPVDRRHSVRFELAAVETEKLRAFSEPFDWFDKLSGTTGTTIAALSYHFGDVRWYPRSVSYERGYAAEASLAFASSGGESWVLLRGEASFFGTLEWFHNQVLVARLGFLTATSPRVYYPLGGDPGHLPFET